MLFLTCRASVASKLGVLMSTDKESHLAESVYDVETMANVSTVLFCRKQTTSNFRLRTPHSAATARRSGIARCIGPENLIEAGGERVVKSGESWTESVGYVHAVANKGTSSARVVASYLVPKGAARTTMVK